MTDVIPDPKEKARATYDSASDFFDHPALAFWDRYGVGTVERLRLNPGARVLDVCCGTGASAIPAARRVGADGRVVGVDLSDQLLALGRAKAAARGLANIEFVNADMTDLPYPDHHFDAVVCVFGIFFVSDMESQVAELWRMVKPRGRLAITTWGPRIFAPVADVWNETLQEVRPDLYSAYVPWERITTTESVRKLFEDAGVPSVEVVAEPGEQPLSTPEDAWTIALGSGLRWTIDQMGPETASGVKRTIVDWVEENDVGAVETNVIYAVATRE